MTLTERQRKQIWIAAALVAAVYFGPSLITAVQRSFAPRPPVIARPSPAHIAPPAPADPAAVQTAATIAQFNRLAGNWSGAATLPQGMVRVALQIRGIPDQPGHYTGYATMFCNPTLVLLSQRMPEQQMDIEITKSMTPTSSIMSGSVANGEIVFHVDQAIGTPRDGCVVTEFAVAPFADQVAAIWKAGNCAGGQMVLNRVSNLR